MSPGVTVYLVPGDKIPRGILSPSVLFCPRGQDTVAMVSCPQAQDTVATVFCPPLISFIYLSLCCFVGFFLISAINVLHLLTLKYTNHTGTNITSHIKCCHQMLTNFRDLIACLYYENKGTSLYCSVAWQKDQIEEIWKISEKGQGQGFTRYYNCLMLSPLPPHSIWLGCNNL